MDVFLLIFGALFLVEIYLKCKPVYSVLIKKAELGHPIVELNSVLNFIWIIPVLLLWFLWLKSNRPFKLEHFDLYQIGNMLIFVVATISLFFLSLQKRAIWSGGITEPMQGAWLWNEIDSFTCTKEGPYEFERFYFWLGKDEYIVTFQIVTINAMGWKEITVKWKVPEKLKDQVLTALRERIPEQEIKSLLDGTS